MSGTLIISLFVTPFIFGVLAAFRRGFARDDALVRVRSSGDLGSVRANSDARRVVTGYGGSKIAFY